MQKRFIIVVGLLLIVLVALAACAPQTVEVTRVVTQTETQTEQVEVTRVVTETETVTEQVEVPVEVTRVVTEEVMVEGASGTDLPRNETLYFNGFQWSPVVCWNPYSANCNNPMAFEQNAASTVTMFETPYMYNPLDGQLYPLLADGDPVWNEDQTELTYKIKPAAMWSDGTPVTAADAAYTWAAHVKYETTQGVGYQDFIDTVEAVDDHTVLIKSKLTDAGQPVNPLQLTGYISSIYILQQAWTEALEARAGEDAAAFKADGGNDVVYSGPYHAFFADDTKVVLIRDDDYWGQDASMWGKLPVPKYLAHAIYADNNAGLVGLKAGEVDVSQQFNANVQDLWLVDGLPVSTYLPDAPYSITASLPTAYFNVNSYGLDNPTVRKAIAMAVDYDTIIANAMTNQSPTFEQVPRSVMNPTDGEQALYDHEAVADLQWAGNDVDGANALLDEAGIVDTDGDGIREIDGQNLSYKALCPNGWSDWQAAIEIVAAAGEKIGIDITTEFPEWGVYQTVFTDAAVNDYDIFMVWSNGAGPTNPWGRVRQFMSSEFAGTSGNWNGNWGGYVNPRIDEIIAEIPLTTDPDALKALYTEATQIYLTDVPSFTLMYRPDWFHTVNESVWTNFPQIDDGTDPPVPPTNLVRGYGAAGLYNLELVEQ
ncbi:MAG: ABC transporter substrate-binding protein [Candidatus Promineifilaceae bacterium]|jgi:peptide/nickel transport system substrate-binding protein